MKVLRQSKTPSRRSKIGLDSRQTKSRRGDRREVRILDKRFPSSRRSKIGSGPRQMKSGQYD